jgi:7-cyano-7-deazaguanine reductase
MEPMSILQEDFWLPRSGPMPRPKSIAEAVEVLRREAFPAPGVSQVRFHAREFTSICPRSGQPDFGEVIIEYAPDKLCLESKSLKFYLWAFREEAGYAEGLAARIADDLYEVLQPRWVRVIVRQYPRGGIEIEAEAVRPNP